MNLNDDVVLVNKGKKFDSKWDGKKFVISNKGRKDVKRGLALHFIEKYPDAKLEIEEIEDEAEEEREVKGEKQEEQNAFDELEG